MDIRIIVTDVLQTGVLTDAQEEKILSLIKARSFDEDDAEAIDELMEALASGLIKRTF